MTQTDAETAVIYDGHCPVCTLYVCNVASDVLHQPRLANARDENGTGVDASDGMILVVDGRTYQGAEAMHQIALRDRSGGLKGWIHRRAFGNLALTRALYPVLLAGRRVLLFVLRRSPKL